MSVGIDWAIVLTETPIIKYLSKNEVIDLSLTNKSTRDKLHPVIFKEMEISEKVLQSYPNYFKQEKYYQFDSFNFKDKFRLVRKYGLSKELAFKEIYIDPIIEEFNNTVKLSHASTHCKDLTLHLLHISSYYMLRVFNNFLNLNELTLRFCEIPYTEFSNLLTKLEKLEALRLNSVNLILNKSEGGNLERRLLFPKTLIELTYLSVSLRITDSPQLKHLNYVRNSKFLLNLPCLSLKPQVLPNLKYLNYFDNSWGTGLTKEFIVLNPKVEVLDGSINLGLLH